MGRPVSFRPIIVWGILLAAVAPVRAQQLIGPGVNPPEHGIGAAREQDESIRSRYATVNPAALKGSTIGLSLFPDVSVTAIERSRGRQFRAETWTGVIDGYPRSSAVFALGDGGVLFGKVEFDESTFLIRQKSGEIYAIEEVGPGSSYDEGFDDEVTLPESDFETRFGKNGAASACLASTSCSSRTIDVMVVYTQQALLALGGSNGAAEAAIAAAVAEMNAANSNSGVTHAINLVYTDEVFYLESGNANTDLSRLSTNFDGYMDVVLSWRETYGADLVSLITDTGGCGIGYTQSTPTAFSSAAAFSVIRNDCLTNNKSLAHEMGHNMGLHHDWFVNSNTTPCSWHHGYVNQAAFGGVSGQRWRTIMAYNNQCSEQGGFTCPRITYWSNPLRLHDGDAMGVPQSQSNPADAVFALNRTACQVADFRASTSPPSPPASPTNLVASGASASSVDVAWKDNATDETGYKVQRSANGSSGWSDIVTLAANARSYSDTGLSEGTAYYYRTYAVRNGEKSGFSNVDSAMTTVSYSDYAAAAESLRYGWSSNDLASTTAGDGSYETLEEEETAGWVQARTSRLDVTWRFDLSTDDPLTFYVNAWHSISTDADAFVMSYSTDGISFSQMFELSQTSDNGVYESFQIGSVAGTSVWIRLEDTDRLRGSRSVDRVFVDHMYIRSQASGGTPPPVSLEPTIHLGNLEMDASGKKRWTSAVNVVVHDGAHEPEAGVDVNGVWSEGEVGSCLTDDAGSCQIESAWKPKVKVVTFTVTALSKPGSTYEESSNDVAATVAAISPDDLSKQGDALEIPASLILRSNYPNPFNPTTMLEYGLPEAGPVRVSVFNSLGMEIERLRDGFEEAGWHRVSFDGSGMSSGVYFAVVQTAAGSQSRTMLLAK